MAKERTAKNRPDMPFFGKQFYDDESVWLSSLAHQGLYIALLWNQWKERSIPDDVRLIARLVGQTEREVRKLWPIIAPHFQPHSIQGRLFNQQLEDIRAQKQKFSESQSDRANARWHPEHDAEMHAGSGAGNMLAVAVAVPFSQEPVTNST